MLTSGHDERSSETRGSSYRYYLLWVLGFVAAPVLVLAGILIPAASVGAPLLQGTPTPAALVYLPHVTNQYAAITATPIPTPTATAVPTGEPDPYYPYSDFSVRNQYDPFGIRIGISVGMEVANRGAAGQVFVRVQWKNRGLTAAAVFSLEAQESVMLWAHFQGVVSYPPVRDTFEWSTRAASPGDTAAGNIEVMRSTLKRLGLYPADSVQEVAVMGGLAYVLRENYLCVVDISNPSAPSQVGSCKFVGQFYTFSENELVLKDNYAYLTIGHLDRDGENGLHIVDLAAGNAKVGQYPTGESERPLALAVSGNYAYVVAQEMHITRGHLLVIDASDPQQPALTGQLQLSPYSVQPGIAISGTYAYLADRSRLYVIGVGTAASPQQVVTYTYSSGTSYSGGEQIVISGNLGYVERGGCELAIIDLSTPTSPSKIGQWSPSDGRCSLNDIAVLGDRAYLAGSDGLQVIDVSNPSSPVEVGRYVGMRAGGESVAADANYVYLGGSEGLHILE